MQPKNKNDSIQFSLRYWSYMLAKGHLRGERRPEIFPIRESGEGINDPDREGTQTQIHPTIDTRTGSYPKWGTYINVIDKKGKPKNKDYAATLSGGAHSGGNHSDMDLLEITKNKPDAQRIYDSNGIAKTLKGLGGGQGAKTGLYAIPVLTPDRINKRQNGRRFKEDGEPAFTLTGQDKHGIYNGTSIRRLTPTECERLQAFPDGWTEGVSDTQRYKMLGNALTTNVVKAIGERLLCSINAKTAN